MTPAGVGRDTTLDERGWTWASRPSSLVVWRSLPIARGGLWRARHTFQGTDAQAMAGPDLTRLASRMTLAAGRPLNNWAAPGGWILDPRTMKPGIQMPPTDLSRDELIAQVAYLDSLE